MRGFEGARPMRPLVAARGRPEKAVRFRATDSRSRMSQMGRQRQPEPMSNGHWAVVRRRLARGFIERLLRRSRLREPEFANVSCTLRPVVADMNFAALERPVVAGCSRPVTSAHSPLSTALPPLTQS